MEKKPYTAEFKLQVVLESLQRDTTVGTVCQKFGVSRSQLWRWRQEFQERAPGLFVDKRNPKEKAISQGYEPGESPEALKKIIRELAMQKEILQKVSRLLGEK
jgi:transposase-like protein